MAGRLAVASLIGLAVGTEREWSQPAASPRQRYAGTPIFLLLAMLGGVAGLLATQDSVTIAALLLGGGVLLSVIGYATASLRQRRTFDATTGVAALVVLGLGALAAQSDLKLVAGAGAVVVFVLGGQRRLPGIVGRIGQQEMHAGLEFLVLALVVLPLLPSGPFHAFFDIRPRALWALVLLLTAINGASYVARRLLGSTRGYGVTGLLAGFISSTVLTLQFSELSRREPTQLDGLAVGTVAASTALPLRLLLLTILLNPLVARAALIYAIPALLIGGISTLVLWRERSTVIESVPEPRNPLRLGAALQIAVVLEIVFLAVGYARAHWGSAGIVGSSVVFGLADLDALTASMARLPGGAVIAATAARGIGIGILTNTVAKAAIVIATGPRPLQRKVLPAFGLTVLGLVGVLWARW